MAQPVTDVPLIRFIVYDYESEYSDDAAEPGITKGLKLSSNSDGMGAFRMLLLYGQQHRENIDRNLTQLNVCVEVSTFPNFRQNRENGSQAINASSNIHFSAAVCKMRSISVDTVALC